MLDFVDEVLEHCAYAIGCGAQMNIQRTALIALRNHVEGPAAGPGMRQELTRPQNPQDPNDPPPGQPRWNKFASFILNCCQSIGRLAADNARQRGSITITLNDDLKPAYNKVSAANTGGPGPFCPLFL